MERVGWLMFVERADSLNQPIQTQTDRRVRDTVLIREFFQRAGCRYEPLDELVILFLEMPKPAGYIGHRPDSARE